MRERPRWRPRAEGLEASLPDTAGAAFFQFMTMPRRLSMMWMRLLAETTALAGHGPHGLQQTCIVGLHTSGSSRWCDRRPAP